MFRFRSNPMRAPKTSAQAAGISKARRGTPIKCRDCDAASGTMAKIRPGVYVCTNCMRRV